MNIWQALGGHFKAGLQGGSADQCASTEQSPRKRVPRSWFCTKPCFSQLPQPLCCHIQTFVFPSPLSLNDPVVTQPLPFPGSAQDPRQRFGVRHKRGHVSQKISPWLSPAPCSPLASPCSMLPCGGSLLRMCQKHPFLADSSGSIPRNNHPPFSVRHLACTEQEKYGKLEFPSL